MRGGASSNGVWMQGVEVCVYKTKTKARGVGGGGRVNQGWESLGRLRDDGSVEGVR